MEVRKPHMSKEKTDKFCYPCAHATSKNGVMFLYSAKKEQFFGVKKVIFGKASPHNAFFDKNGDYGLTQHTFAIPVENDLDGEMLLLFVKTENFRKIISATKFSGFETEQSIFQSFRKDFWKEFITEEGTIIEP